MLPHKIPDTTDHPARQSDNSATVLKTLKILLVDDDRKDALLLSEMLSAATSVAYSIHIARSLEHCERTLSSSLKPFDIALLSLSLPDSKGLDTLKRFLEMAPSIPVIAMTRRWSVETGIMSIQNGAQEYLAKSQTSSPVLLRSVLHAIERQRIQNALTARTNDLQLILDSFPDAAGLLDSSLQLVAANDIMAGMIGLTSAEAAGKPLLELLSPSSLQIWSQKLQEGLKRNTETAFVETRDGRHYQHRIVPISKAGSAEPRFAFFTREATDAEAAPSQESQPVTDDRTSPGHAPDAILNSLPCALVTINSSMEITQVNQAFEDLTGLPLEECVGRHISHCLNLYSKPALDQLSRVIEENLTLSQRNVEVQNRDGSRLRVTLTAAPLATQAGEADGAVIVLQDVAKSSKLERATDEDSMFHKICGQSKQMQEIFRLLDRVAHVDATVLITGESGTGKELIADALHSAGPRAARAMIKVNCSALPESLLESELFGHVKGAFTGAVKDKVGRIQAAEGGTIFLDEIGDISPSVQLKLLRFLEQKEYERVGDSRTFQANVRVVTATNKDLQEEVRLGRFREDLYYRLKVMTLHLPPLRERREDIPLLIRHFLSALSSQMDKLVGFVADEVLQAFADHSWPGNIRELKHVLEHAVILSNEGVVTLEHLPPDFQHHPVDASDTGHQEEVPAMTERDRLINALRQAKWRKNKAAEVLGISRSTLYRKMEEYNITSM